MFSLVWEHWDNQEQTCVVTAASVGRQGNLTTCVQKGQCRRRQTLLSCSLHPERNKRTFTDFSPLSFIALASFLTRYYVTFTLAQVLKYLPVSCVFGCHHPWELWCHIKGLVYIFADNIILKRWKAKEVRSDLGKEEDVPIGVEWGGTWTPECREWFSTLAGHKNHLRSF